jgi:molybdopterin/thiamine biosynthesis adenylyltransferase
MNEPICCSLPQDFEAKFYSRTLLFAKYALRWKKTPNDAFLMSQLKKAHIAICCNKELLDTPNGQHIVLMSINLLSRFCQNLDLSMSKVQPKINFPLINKTSFIDCLLKLFKAINPLGRIKPKIDPHRLYDAVLVIGEENVRSKRTISVNSDGWLTYLYPDRKHFARISENQNPLGAQLSACFGVAEIFKAIFSKTLDCNPLDVSSSESLTFSILDYALNTPSTENPVLPESFHLGSIHLIGAGAIGSATAYSLRSIHGVSGALTVIDPETIEVSNLNRYLPVTAKDAIENKPKVNIVKGLLSDSGLQVTVFRKAYQNYAKKRTPNLDLAVVAVDNDQTRWTIQNDFPRVILNGATGVSSLTISRHDDFLEKACLGCLYPKGQEPTAPLPCPTISFISATGGVLLAAEIIKERVKELSKFALNNELYLDCFKIPQTLRIRQPQKSELCGCTCQDKKIIKSYINARKLFTSHPSIEISKGTSN